MVRIVGFMAATRSHLSGTVVGYAGSGEDDSDAVKLLEKLRDKSYSAMHLRRSVSLPLHCHLATHRINIFLQLRKYAVRRGGSLPHSIRWAAWPVLLGVDNLMAATPGLYANMLRLGRSASDVDIRKDIGRTLPREPLLASALHKRWRGPGLGMLYRVLTAFSNVAPDIGYTQGMSFLAAVPLIVGMPEHVAFYWLLAAMYRLHLAVLYKPPLVAPQVAVEVAHALAQRRRPRLVAHLDGMGVCSGSLYSISWLLSLFSSSILPLSSILGIFDCMHTELLEEAVTRRVPTHILRTHAVAQSRLQQAMSSLGRGPSMRSLQPALAAQAHADPRVAPVSQVPPEGGAAASSTAHAKASQAAKPPKLPSAKQASALYLARILRIPRVLFRAILAHVFQLEQALLACDAFDGVVQVLAGEHLKRVRDQWLRERVLTALEAQATDEAAPGAGMSSSNVMAPSPADPVIQVSSSAMLSSEQLSEAVLSALANESLAPPYTLRPIAASSPVPPPFHTTVSSETPTSVDILWQDAWGGRSTGLLPSAAADGGLPAAAMGPPRRWSSFRADEGGPLVLPGYIKAALACQQQEYPARIGSSGEPEGGAAPALGGAGRSSSISLPASRATSPANSGAAAARSEARDSARPKLKRSASMHPAALVLSAGGTHVDALPAAATVMCDGLPCEPWMLPGAFLDAMNHKAVRVSDKDIRRAFAQAQGLLGGVMMTGAAAAGGGLDPRADEELEWSAELCEALQGPIMLPQAVEEQVRGGWHTVPQSPDVDSPETGGARDAEHSHGDQRRGWHLRPDST